MFKENPVSSIFFVKVHQVYQIIYFLALLFLGREKFFFLVKSSLFKESHIVDVDTFMLNFC
jgi:hypothetical protein